MNNKYKVIFFIIAVLQVFFIFSWMNNNDRDFFKSLHSEKPQDIDFINIYYDFGHYQRQDLFGGYTQTNEVKMSALLGCIQNAKKIPRMEGEAIIPEKVVVIKFRDGGQYAIEITITKSKMGFTGKYYNYYNYSNDISIPSATRVLKAECLYDWFQKSQ